jgi:hypothetical protein
VRSLELHRQSVATYYLTAWPARSLVALQSRRSWSRHTTWAVAAPYSH